MNPTVYLKCKTGPGQFSDEFAVSAHDIDGEGFSLFAPREFVEQDRLQVTILKHSGDACLVRLPASTLGRGNTVIVWTSQLADMVVAT